MLPSMKVIFEVDSLVHASPATISRCGMVFMVSWLLFSRVETIEFKARRARVESLTFSSQEKVKPLISHPERV